MSLPSPCPSPNFGDPGVFQNAVKQYLWELEVQMRRRILVSARASGVHSGIDIGHRRRRGLRSRLPMLTAAAMAGAAACIGSTETTRADGTFIGAQVSVTQTRKWDLGGADPGLNWNLDTLPTAAEALDFTICGDGTIDLG